MAFKYSMLVFGVMTVFGMSETNQKSDNKQDQSVDNPNKYFIATVFSGKGKGIVLGHDPLGVEMGFTLRFSDILDREVNEINVNYYYFEDSIVVDQDERITNVIYDYDNDYNIDIYISKKLFKRETINRKYALYCGFEFSKSKYSYKYTVHGGSNYSPGQFESIYLIDSYGILLGYKFEYRFLKHLSFEIDVPLFVQYEIEQDTENRWYYNSELELTGYYQDLNKTYRLNFDLESPRLIFKYYF